MSMNHHTPPPAPRPMCAIYELQLPLFLLGDLDADETAALQAHLAECEYCQRMLRKYETLRGALTRHFSAEAPSPQPVTRSSRSGARSRWVSPTTPAPLTVEDIIQAASEPSLSAATTEPSSSHPTVLSGGRKANVLGAIAAVLVLSILAASLFAYLGSRGVAPTAQPTPTPGLDGQSQAYVNVLRTYYTPLAQAFNKRGCPVDASPQQVSLMTNCQTQEATILTQIHAFDAHLTVQPPARWQTADTQFKQANQAMIPSFSAAVNATDFGTWQATLIQLEVAEVDYCAPVQQINGDLLQAGQPLSSLLPFPQTVDLADGCP